MAKAAVRWLNTFDERLTEYSDTVRSASFGWEIEMRKRRFAVVASIVALLLGSVGSVATYEVLRSDADSPVPMILQACVEGDSDSCYSFAGLKMSWNRDMALAALEMCAADKRSDFLFDCMFKLAQAYQTGRSGQRSFVMAYQWYSTLIAEDGPAAFLEVA